MATFHLTEESFIELIEVRKLYDDLASLVPIDDPARSMLLMIGDRFDLFISERVDKDE